MRHVSVIVLNVNGAQVLDRCLRQLMEQTYPAFDIIVVDNGSTDDSVALLERYMRCGRLSVIRSPYNRGCPGGRNLGLQYATGDIVAFIDNDGFAAPDWLERAVERLESDPRIGAVASMVFFARHPLIVNGIGGALNLQGYGRDHCTQESYEFLQPPDDVVYPMGCGMIVRRDVFDRFGPLDETVANYYDDVEVGLRAHKLGYRVVTAPEAWIDHEFNYSTQYVADKYLLSEKARIRLVLRYFPTGWLPRWLWNEGRLVLAGNGRGRLRLKAWVWNLGHMFSILKSRWQLRHASADFMLALTPVWGSFDPALEDNRALAPDLRKAQSALSLDGQRDTGRLQYGWHSVGHDSGVAFRWTAQHASAFFRLDEPGAHVTFEWIPCARGQQTVTIWIRPVGEVEPIWSAQVQDATVGWVWQRHRFECALPAGLYECVLQNAVPFLNDYGALLGSAIRSIAFEYPMP